MDDPYMAAVVVIVFIATLYGAILTTVSVRKGACAARRKPNTLLTMVMTGSTSNALRVVLRCAQQFGYKIDDIDEAKGRIILSDSITLTSWGCFYPIYVTEQNDHTVLVEVGMVSKWLQLRLLVARDHERCLNAVKATYLLYAEKDKI